MRGARMSKEGTLASGLLGRKSPLVFPACEVQHGGWREVEELAAHTGAKHRRTTSLGGMAVPMCLGGEKAQSNDIQILARQAVNFLVGRISQ